MGGGSLTSYSLGETNNLTCRKASNVVLKLDVDLPQPLAAPNRTVINIHGGGWMVGSKESEALG